MGGLLHRLYIILVLIHEYNHARSHHKLSSRLPFTPHSFSVNGSLAVFMTPVGDLIGYMTLGKSGVWKVCGQYEKNLNRELCPLSAIWLLEDRWRRHLTHPNSPGTGACHSTGARGRRWEDKRMEAGVLGHWDTSRDTWSHFATLKASVMSTASAPCHYLSLHALISSPIAPWDTYNEGNTEQSWCQWNRPLGQQG
ncbi:hypothetical protein GOODEAATRI_011042 [Goodea atripinnis]|uniref:Uncharacterized protein n=1 Tax=Goodea atripinnis TaxID=208336 RepID=A0ABV0PD56_9TELE